MADKTPEQRALDIIASLDKPGKSRLAKLFSRMKFEKDPTLMSRAKSRLAKIERASNPN